MRRGPNAGKRIEKVVLADLRRSFDDDVRLQAGTVAYAHLVSHLAIRADVDILGELGSRMHDCGKVDFHTYLSTMADNSSASATN